MPKKNRNPDPAVMAPWLAAMHDAVEAVVDGTDPAAAVAHLDVEEAERALAVAWSIYPKVEDLARRIHAIADREERVRAVNRYRDDDGELSRHAALAARLVARWDRRHP